MSKKTPSNKNRQPFDDTAEERALREDRVAFLSKMNFSCILDLLIENMSVGEISEDDAIEELISRAGDFYSLLALVTQEEGKLEKIMDNTERARECLALSFEYIRIADAFIGMNKKSAKKLVDLRKKDLESHAIDLLEVVIKKK